MSASNSPRKSTFLTLLQPMGAAVGAIFALGILIVATRQGQFTEIASFGVGAGVAALASVAVGGGTTFAYTTGDTARQRAVRLVRGTLVLPAIAVATAAGAALYSMVGQLEPLGVIAGGLATMMSVGAELDASYLRRHLKTGRLFVADTFNRMFAFGMIVVGVPFPFAMLAGAVSRALFLRVFTRTDPSRERTFRISRSALALAYEAKLTSLSIFYSVCDRIGALMAPMTAPVPVSGGFMAVVSAQQNASGVLLTGLQTTLAARSQQRSRLRWANRVDLLFVVAGFAAATLMIVLREPFIDFLALDAVSEPGEYWVAIALLLPFSTASRVFEFRFLATDSSHKAVISRVVATVIAVGASVIALIGSNIAVLANGLLAAEVASVLVSIVLLIVQGVRRKRGCEYA